MTFLLAVSISAHANWKLLCKQVKAAKEGTPRWSNTVPIERREQTPQEIKKNTAAYLLAKYCHASPPEAEIELRDVRAPVQELHMHNVGGEARS